MRGCESQNIRTHSVFLHGCPPLIPSFSPEGRRRRLVQIHAKKLCTKGKCDSPALTRGKGGMGDLRKSLPRGEGQATNIRSCVVLRDAPVGQSQNRSPLLHRLAFIHIGGETGIIGLAPGFIPWCGQIVWVSFFCQCCAIRRASCPNSSLFW